MIPTPALPPDLDALTADIRRLVTERDEYARLAAAYRRRLEDQVGKVCRGCGCSAMAACSGGCDWVEEDLCTSCARPPSSAASAEAPPSPTSFAASLRRLADLVDTRGLHPIMVWPARYGGELVVQLLPGEWCALPIQSEETVSVAHGADHEQYGVEEGGIAWVTELGAPPAPLASAAVS